MIRCQADQLTRAHLYRAYVAEAVRRADNFTYHFDHLQRHPGVSSRPSRDRLESVLAVTSGGVNNLVSTTSLCAWYINATYHPNRVICTLYRGVAKIMLRGGGGCRRRMWCWERCPYRTGEGLWGLGWCPSPEKNQMSVCVNDAI